jgi:hypothetical protein
MRFESILVQVGCWAYGTEQHRSVIYGQTPSGIYAYPDRPGGGAIPTSSTSRLSPWLRTP